MQLTQIERAWLLILFNEGYMYLARDKCGELYAYKSKPRLAGGTWTGDGRNYEMDEDLFSISVLSSDTTPYKIVCNASLDYYDLEEV